MKDTAKKITALVCIMLIVTAFTGCANIFNGGKNVGNRFSQTEEPKEGDEVAEIVIDGYGSIRIRLFRDKAPKAVENFVKHAQEGYYDGVKFHRVIADFMIQGGDPTGTGRGGESIYGVPFEDEFTDDLEPIRGALCMANAGANTNGSQFFIVQKTPESVKEMVEMLQYKGYSLKEYVKAGYSTELSDAEVDTFMKYGGAPWLSKHHTVFGQMYDGFDVLDSISATATNEKSVPVEDVIIKTIKITTYGK